MSQPEKCGCELDESYTSEDGTFYNGIINYCPTHQAAFELKRQRDALLEAAKWLWEQADKLPIGSNEKERLGYAIKLMETRAVISQCEGGAAP